MARSHKLLLALATSAAFGALAAPSLAVVGGHDTSDARYRGVAKITFGAFQCTGTLIAPQWVLTAGHCGSLTGAAVATPASWPAPLIDVAMGATTASAQKSYSVSQAVVEPQYLNTQGYDITLLKLTAPVADIAPVQVAGGAERALWGPGVLESIVGWGVTKENGNAPSVLQEAQVPIVADADCAAVYDTFEAKTQICAGYPQGGTDTCQGDSGGPMFATIPGTTTLRVVGATSYGNGCARAGIPGVYARVGDDTLRTWIASQTAEGVGPATAPAKAKKARKAKKTKARRA
jgi:secreted trypsin-like serine protease